jgi:Bacterial SH3 domain
MILGSAHARGGARLAAAAIATCALLLALAPAPALLAATAVQPSAGYTAAALYNQGNAYARAGKPGLAVLAFERAKLLSPNDADIDANLHRVRETAGLAQTVPSRIGTALTQLRPDLLAWLGMLGLAAAGVGLLARLAFPAQRRKLLIPVVLGMSCVALAVAAGASVWPKLFEAVVVGHSVPVRVSPVLIEETLFTLPEGETVTVRDEHDGFMLVKTAGGRTGWAPASNIAPVIPRR